MITFDQARSIMPLGVTRLSEFLLPLNSAMVEFDIKTPLQQAAFLAQIAHESGELRYTRELASGEAYEGRASLGNTEPGDGKRFKGRGLIQITGRANYKACSNALYGDELTLIKYPELLEKPKDACRSACWFWKSRGLNAPADAGDFEKITRRINGGLNGYDDRLKYYARAKKALGVAA
ncbi:putative chitinase [Methylovorus glucosotrophus]|uniref:glycoside hydrolase family 19 protein n=1 Tax=Methylovorus glucosotrophus TaxID=266009 RepID=UPI0013318BC5|nr:glycoside hydrolase family 19 protein [Methylovorus glucosotrophus]KAF0844318.1 putative chitinase [Methylovorus glucosotrophus]